MNQDTVQLTSKGYEWTCPECYTLNETEEAVSEVQCDICYTVFKTEY